MSSIFHVFTNTEIYIGTLVHHDGILRGRWLLPSQTVQSNQKRSKSVLKILLKCTSVIFKHPQAVQLISGARRSTRQSVNEVKLLCSVC